MNHGSVVFFWMKTSSTHYQGAVLLTNWLFVYYAQTINITRLFVHMSGNKQSIYENGLALLGGLAMCTVHTNIFTCDQLELRLSIY